MKTLYIIRGVPGSGKTTQAKKLVDSKHICESDEFMVDNQGNYAFDPSRLSYCHEMSKRKCEMLMISGVEKIAVSNTSIKKWEVEPYVNLARQYVYDVEIMTMKGTYKNLHGVPDEKIKQMKDRFEQFTIKDFK